MGLYDDVYAALEAADVRFVVVGGMAVVLSGHLRTTVDLDLVVDLAPEPAARAVAALSGLGFAPRVPVRPVDFADPRIRLEWIDTKHMQVLSFRDPQHPAREVDVFVTYPMDFEQLITAAVPTRVGDHSVLVACIEDLVTMKLAAGRPQDLADIDALQRLRDRRSR
ncbi:MAG TPA: nucleotidyl transferase AbiEii/AbiGii toxin family protein [Sporichthyaceae bacterium]|nr:nucleotidyl transferase AbiEii/AbiGii toxin family protein [Sporichthyaceae bacterium]